MAKVAITMQGGIVTSVVSSDEELEVYVLDYDSEGCDPDEIALQDEIDAFVDNQPMYPVDWKSGVAEDSMDFNVVE